jgi:hypothetical protein
LPPPRIDAVAPRQLATCLLPHGQEEDPEQVTIERVKLGDNSVEVFVEEDELERVEDNDYEYDMEPPDCEPDEVEPSDYEPPDYAPEDVEPPDYEPPDHDEPDRRG